VYIAQFVELDLEVTGVGGGGFVGLKRVDGTLDFTEGSVVDGECGCVVDTRGRLGRC